MTLRLDALEPERLDEQMGAAAAVLTLRDAFDEAFAVRADAWRTPAPAMENAAAAWLALVAERS